MKEALHKVTRINNVPKIDEQMSEEVKMAKKMIKDDRYEEPESFRCWRYKRAADQGPPPTMLEYLSVAKESPIYALSTVVQYLPPFTANPVVGLPKSIIFRPQFNESLVDKIKDIPKNLPTRDKVYNVIFNFRSNSE